MILMKSNTIKKKRYWVPLCGRLQRRTVSTRGPTLETVADCDRKDKQEVQRLNRDWREDTSGMLACARAHTRTQMYVHACMGATVDTPPFWRMIMNFLVCRLQPVCVSSLYKGSAMTFHRGSPASFSNSQCGWGEKLLLYKVKYSVKFKPAKETKSTTLL